MGRAVPEGLKLACYAMASIRGARARLSSAVTRRQDANSQVLVWPAFRDEALWKQRRAARESAPCAYSDDAS